jgi:hypothetical protein
MKKVIKLIKQAAKKVNDTAKDYFAPVVIIDNFGTRKLCWTLKQAEAWLPYCGDKAYILETCDYEILVKRIQSV